MIFGVQSLENRNQSLEQSMLNFIHPIVSFVYPQWCSLVENHIKDGTISNAYFESLIGGIGDEKGWQKKQKGETKSIAVEYQQT